MLENGGSVPAAKRKRVVLLLESKLDILDQLSKKNLRLASEYGVGKSTVCDIKKNEEK